jgi:CRISPR-associated protein Csm1
MEDTTLKIALAGLLHDIGKFADNEIFRLNQKEIAAKRSEFVSGKQNSYNHAVYTSEFISVYKKYLPEICSITEWGEGNESLEIIAASHHSPGSPYQEIITQADCISSGMDRQNSQDNDSTDYREYKNTRMVPVLEALDFDKKNFNKPYTKDNFKYMLSLKEVNPASIFPVPKNENNQKNKKESANEYIELFNRFENDLSKIIHKDKIELWFEHIDSLLQKYTSMIPSARAGKTVPDISLYDHLKTTSGIAAAIYLYHKENDSLSTNDIKDKNTKKFILISGDFHGIQEFIFTGYGDTRKSRSKLFRGRSFYVSLAAELAADLLCLKSLEKIKKCEIKEAEQSKGIITAHSGTTWKTWGEIINFEIINNEDSKKTCIKISSSPLVSTTLVDFGKNYENVKKISDFLKEKGGK